MSERRTGARYRTPWKYVGVGVSFAVTLALAMYFGYKAGEFLDGRLGTDPWFQLGGIMLGVVAGFRILIRDLLRDFRASEGEGPGRESDDGDR